VHRCGLRTPVKQHCMRGSRYAPIAGRLGLVRPQQMSFAKNQDVIQAVPPKRPDQAFNIGVLPGDLGEIGRSRIPIAFLPRDGDEWRTGMNTMPVFVVLGARLLRAIARLQPGSIDRKARSGDNAGVPGRPSGNGRWR
jgi:hypothetical protein